MSDSFFIPSPLFGVYSVSGGSSAHSTSFFQIVIWTFKNRLHVDVVHQYDSYHGSQAELTPYTPVDEYNVIKGHVEIEILLESMMVAERGEFLCTSLGNKGNGYRPGSAYGQGYKLEFRIPHDRYGNSTSAIGSFRAIRSPWFFNRCNLPLVGDTRRTGASKPVIET